MIISFVAFIYLFFCSCFVFVSFLFYLFIFNNQIPALCTSYNPFLDNFEKNEALFE